MFIPIWHSNHFWTYLGKSAICNHKSVLSSYLSLWTVRKKWLNYKTICFAVYYCFFYTYMLSVASAHYCLGLTKVTKQQQLWQEMDIISEGQSKSTLILLSSINVSLKAVLSHCHFCENKRFARDLHILRIFFPD